MALRNLLMCFKQTGYCDSTLEESTDSTGPICFRKSTVFTSSIIEKDQ